MRAPGSSTTPTTSRSGTGFLPPVRGRKFRDCLDGLSNTLALAEVKAWTPYFRDAGIAGNLPMPMVPADVCAMAGSFKQDTGHTEWVDGRVHQSGFTTTFPPNQKVLCNVSGRSVRRRLHQLSRGKEFGLSDAADLWCGHGAKLPHRRRQRALLDGSIRFITDSIDRELWQHLSTRSGHEWVEVPE